MSRSYKKHPFYTDGRAGGPKFAKRRANRRIRHSDFDNLPLKGKSYKKFYEQWEIHDWKCRETFQEAIEFWEKIYPDLYENKKECFKAWYKTMKAK